MVLEESMRYVGEELAKASNDVRECGDGDDLQ